MASSGMLSEHQTTNPPIRRSSGRRKAKGGGGDSKKKKQPQRGMGVEKLEKLRLQEIPETDQPGFLSFTNPFSDMSPLQFTRNRGFQYGSVLHNHVHVFGINDSDFLPKNCNVIAGNVVKCFSLHCNACHKKKKINGENTGVRSEMCKAGDNQNMMMINQDSIMHKPQVEVVAVHRKGSCTSSWDGGNRVLMEYDFFPAGKSGGASIDSDDGGELEAVKQPPAGFDASNCVDLSLKLSH
ncbi:hypothetical protein C2S51_009760 [Perilla frutescens var. frutescens]|nr:hypothetical protein C2S51_009760 [Perilla frutescens var. frutescens]